MLSEKGRTSKVHHKLELVMVLTEVIRPLLLPGDFEGEAGQERSTCYSHVYKSLPCVNTITSSSLKEPPKPFPA
jgi:hypothetical protein